MSGVWRIILNKRAKDALMESKSQAELYVDLMGHDINNMNQVALGFLELAIEKLDKEGKLEAADRYLLDRPIDTLNNSARLIKNVKKLQSARKGGLKRRIVDACAMLGSVVREYSDIPGRDISIDYTPPESCYVMANDLLRDVFSNIVGNSIKHSPADRPLEIRIKVIKVRVEGVDNYTIFFEDNGPGISDVKKAGIFGRLEEEAPGGHHKWPGARHCKDAGGRLWRKSVGGGPGTGRLYTGHPLRRHAAGRPLTATFIAGSAYLLFMSVSMQADSDASKRQLARCIELLLEIVEGSSQPFVIADASGLIAGCNGAFCQLVGYTVDELRSRRIAELTPQEWRKQESGIIAGQVRSKMPAIYRKEYLRKDGSRVPVELYDHVIFDEAGRPLYFYAFVTDVADRKGR